MAKSGTTNPRNGDLTTRVLLVAIITVIAVVGFFLRDTYARSLDTIEAIGTKLETHQVLDGHPVVRTQVNGLADQVTRVQESVDDIKKLLVKTLLMQRGGTE